MAAIFRPFRALGCIADELPFAIQRRGKETFAHVSVGRAWQVYNTAKLTLALVGPEMEGEITALACKDDFTFAAVNGNIVAFKRVHRCGTYNSENGNVLQLLILGDLILSLMSHGKLLVWNIGEYDEPQMVLDLGKTFSPSCMTHPETYINKVIVGNKHGKVELWNFISGKKLYTFDFGSQICCLSASPALDVVGVGLADGRAILHNLKFDEQVASFANASGSGAKKSLFLNNSSSKTPAGSACTAISFRTGQGTPLMAAGGNPGVVTVWNLEQRRLHTVIRDAHDASLVSLHFFAGEPRLMSLAADNSLKQWLFDQPDGSGRLLRFRSGHSAPPSIVRSYGDGNRLLSAGSDRAFRMFSTIQDQQSRELSQGHIQSRAKRLKIEQSELKLPPVTALHACQVRERDWANVITAHQDDNSAYTWRLQNFCLGEHVLTPPLSKTSGKKGATIQALPTPVTAVAISSCGNFGLVGSQSGRVDRYNLQSGLHRGTYSRASGAAHDGKIVGLAADSANKSIVTCGEDNFLRVWSFKGRKVEAEIEIGSQPVKMASHPNNSLVAIADDAFQIKMFDVATKRRVRTFTGHSGKILDLSMSSDGVWLMSSSQDGSFRVWDIPSARILQVLKLGDTVTSFSLSQAQEILATTHPGNKGIFLWANSCIFSGAIDVVPSDKLVDARLPSVTTDLEDEEGGAPESSLLAPATPQLEPSNSPAGVSEAKYAQKLSSGAPQPLAHHLITLSLLPKTQWQNLMHIDAIKERSKPVQPPKKPEAAPFFLPTVSTLARNPVFDTDASVDPSGAPDQSGAPEGSLGTSLPGWGDGDEDETNAATTDGVGEPAASKKAKKRKQKAAEAASRVLQNAVPGALESNFILRLRNGRESGDFSECVALLRSMSPVAVDQELQAMQVTDLENAGEQELQDLMSVMQMIEQQLEAGTSYEHAQALLRAFLNIHSDTILEHDGLRRRADDLQQILTRTWDRLGSKLQKVRCLLNFVGNLPS